MICSSNKKDQWKELNSQKHLAMETRNKRKSWQTPSEGLVWDDVQHDDGTTLFHVNAFQKLLQHFSMCRHSFPWVEQMHQSIANFMQKNNQSTINYCTLDVSEIKFVPTVEEAQKKRCVGLA